MAVELKLVCKTDWSNHEFTVNFTEPVDWKAVEVAMRRTRCDEHPEQYYCDYE